MKKLILWTLCCLLCTACGGVRKNWKVMKNTQLIMIGEPINVVKNVYGKPTSIRPLGNGTTAYIWNIDYTKEERGISTSISGSAYKSGYSGHSFSRKVYGGWCFLAVKVDSRGIVTNAIYKGFHDYFADYEPECAEFFTNSRKFCNEVQALSKKKNNQGNCHRQDYTVSGPQSGFVIPTKYYKPPVYKKTDFENFLNN